MPCFARNRFYPKLQYRIFKLCVPIIVDSSQPGRTEIRVQVLPRFTSLKFRRVFVSMRNLPQT